MKITLLDSLTMWWTAHQNVGATKKKGSTLLDEAIVWIHPSLFWVFCFFPNQNHFSMNRIKWTGKSLTLSFSFFLESWSTGRNCLTALAKTFCDPWCETARFFPLWRSQSQFFFHAKIWGTESKSVCVTVAILKNSVYWSVELTEEDVSVASHVCMCLYQAVCVWSRHCCIDVNSGINQRWTLNYTVYQNVTVSIYWSIYWFNAWLFMVAAMQQRPPAEFWFNFMIRHWSEMMSSSIGQMLHYQWLH